MCELHGALLVFLKRLYEHLKQLSVIKQRNAIVNCCTTGQEVVL